MSDTNTPHTSLSAPWDFPEGSRPQIQGSAPELTQTESVEAVKEQYRPEFVQKFRKLERRFADPPLSMQKFALVSFVPSAGAQADEKGVFGFVKVRGCFETEHESAEHAERLIRTTDSYHKIFTTYVGRPFPITVSSDFSKEISEVNLQKEISDVINDDVKRKREKERKDIEEIKEREKNLLEETKKEVEDEKEVYKTLNVKKANLCWQYVEQRKAMESMKQSIIRTRQQIKEIDDVNPEPKQTYYEEYMKARGDRNLDNKDALNNWMKYLINEPEDLGF